MSSEAKIIAEERKKKQEMKAFSDARADVGSKAKEISAEIDGQIAELRKKTVEGFRAL